MAKQVRLNSRQFREFVDCDLTHEIYIRILTQSSLLEQPNEYPRN
jgi:hypothetical protein